MSKFFQSHLYGQIVVRSALTAASVLLVSNGSAEEPGTVMREGWPVFKAPAPEQSEYLIPGIGVEDMYPPITNDSTSVDGLTGVGIRLKGNTWTDLSIFTIGGQPVYQSFLDAMGFANGDQTLTWPVVAGSGDPVDFMGASSISQLYGPYLSRAYFSRFGWYADYTPSPGSTNGFNFYGYPRVGAPEDVQIPPNYPPVTQNISLSNSPLVPATIAGTSRAIYSTRETIDGQLDLITGQPLLREVDLEIPFGGAVFRRIRTYSEMPSTGVQAQNWHDYGSWQRSRSGGWQGSGWMSNDAPLFLIDASFAQTMTTPEDLSPRCVFSIDAHRSIPFTRQVSPANAQSGNAGGFNVDYIAPEWFDAILLHSGGVWDGTTKSWSVYPSEFKVILNKRSVTYVIKPYYEDVAPSDHKPPLLNQQNSSLFDVGANAAMGVPYYGLVTEIRDRSGNRVVYSYASGHQPTDGPTYTYRYRPDPYNEPDVWLETDKYRGIRQRGWYKGMIDNIKLYPAGEQDAAWTLLYTYRAFATRRDRAKNWNFWDFKSFPPSLHSVLAYKEDIDTNLLNRDLILKNHEVPPTDLCIPDPPPPNTDGWTADASDLAVYSDGNSGPGIDQQPFDDGGGLSRVAAIDSPPFSDLLFGTPGDVCEDWMFPVPIKAQYANQFDYQDTEIGPMGEGDDPETWSLPNTWLKQARYSYAEPPQYVSWAVNNYSIADDYTAKSCGPVEVPVGLAANSYTQSVGNQMAYLLKVQTIERAEPIPGASPPASSAPLGIEKYWLYRYQDTEGAKDTKPFRYTWWGNWSGWQAAQGNEMPRRLSYRYGPRAVDNLAANSVWGGTTHSSKNEYVNYIIGLDEDDTVPTIADVTIPIPLYDTADTSYLRWSEPYRLNGIEDGSTGVAFNGDVAYAGSWVAFDGDFDSGSSTPSLFQTDLRDNYLGAVSSDACPDLEISQADQSRTGFLPEGTSVFSNRDSQGNQRWYRIYRFISTPGAGVAVEPGNVEIAWRGVDSAVTTIGGHNPGTDNAFYRGPELVLPGTNSGDAPGATQALYHYPYRFAIADRDWYESSVSTGFAVLERKNPMWWSVVDEYDSLDNALSANSSLTHADSGNDGWSSDFFAQESPWMTRRVVAMNSAGLVLSDRTWDSEGGVNAPPAILEAFEYDDYLRMIKKFSRGWGSELASGNNLEGDEGLIQIFTYGDATETVLDDPNGIPGDSDDVIDLDVPRIVKGVWLNKGCSPAQSGEPGEQHISEMVYYEDVFPNDSAIELFEGQLYSQAVYDLVGNDDLGTLQHRVEYWGPELDGQNNPIESDDYDPENPPVMWELNAGAQFQRDPTGPVLRPVSITTFDRNGRLIWQISGSMANIIDSANGAGINGDVSFVVSSDDELFINYRQYDDEGREYFSVDDIDIPDGLNGTAIESTNAFNLNDIKFPSGLQQQYPIDETMPHGMLFLGANSDVDNDNLFDTLSEFWTQLNTDIELLYGMFRQAQADPLDLITYREFTRFGPAKVVYPTGVRDLYQYSLQSDYLTELKAMGVEFDGESWGFSGQKLYDSDFDGNQFVNQVQSVMDDLLADQWDGDPYRLSSDIFTANRIQVIADVEPNYDSAGRLVSMTVTDPETTAEPIEQFVAYDGWGNILRSQDADGLIDHLTYDKFGRKHKTFKGSKDRHEIWGTADIGQDNDDMLLVEKLLYGLGTNDAGMITHKWMFREKSATQYGIDWDDPSEGDPLEPGFDAGYVAGGSALGETSSGILETYTYDWRMRKVITQYQGLDSAQGNTNVYREERVFLDNANRVRFVAVYDGPANGSAPHPDIEPAIDLPSPAVFFANGAASNLLSLQETVYNGAGQTVENKRYDPDTTNVSQPGFLVTHNFTDHGNRPTWSRDNGQRISKNVYDAKGRLAWSSVWAGGTELSRTINAYGPADTVDLMITFERVDTNGSSIISLDDASINKRVSVLHQWFDRNQRLIARADFGFEEYLGTVDNYLTSSSLIADRPDDPPILLMDLPLPTTTAASLPSRQLIGLDYPAEWIGLDGRGLARVNAYWYGAGGQKNAVLQLLSTEFNGTGNLNLSYTIDRFEYNNYGQKILEHRYGYDISEPLNPSPTTPRPTPEDIATSAEFLGGMAYNYEVEGWSDTGAPPVYASTKVRQISPLTAGHVINYNPDLRRNVVDWASSTDPQRSTVLEYNAPTVQPNFVLPSFVLYEDPQNPYVFPIDSNDWGHIGISNRPDLVKAVHLPDPVGGGTGNGEGYSLFYFYYADGLPAVRLDSRGIAIHYIYDERGNLVRLESDDTNMPLVDSLGLDDTQLPANSIRYEYDAIDRLVLATTGRNYADGTTFRTDSESLMEYDALGNMLKEYQARENTVDTLTTPFVGYEWERVYAQTDYSAGLATRDNINRIASVTYPNRTGTHDDGAYSPRKIKYGYGDAGSISDLLGRVELVTAEGGPTGAPITEIADYQYSGINRLESVLLGLPNGSVQGSGDNILRDVRTFDAFGRVENRTVSAWDADAPTPSYRVAMDSDFGYDLGNRRLFERLKQQDLDSGASPSRDNIHSSFFDYDSAGRLVGEHYGSLNADGFDGINHAASVIDPLSMTYGLDLLNRRVGINSAPGIQVWEDTDKDAIIDPGELLLTQTQQIDERGGLTGLDDGAAIETIAQDSAGAITSLHGRDIYHDWLGRPVLVLDSASGDPVVSYSYDGFGRLATRKAPWPNSNPDKVIQRVETYYYDGVRRIQEVFTDPIAATPPWPVTVPIGGLGGAGSSGDTLRTEAEYIWSAASGQPFDTCHVQIDWWDREAWFIQDHSTGTVRAFVDANGEMVKQYRFDAFGNLKSQDTFALGNSTGLFAGFRQRLGHQGLFAERVDGDTTSATLSPNPNAEVWYQSRSRWYVPELGRFMTSDPNSTGIPTILSLAMLGETSAGAPFGSFDWEAHYGDGWDIYTAYGANPIMNQDPSGLSLLALEGFGGSLRGGLFGALAGSFGTAGSYLGTIYSGVTINSLVMGAGANALIFAEFADIFGVFASDSGTPSQAQQKSKKGQAPGKIGRIDKPGKTKGSQWHTHRKGKGKQPATNADGTIHDKSRGDPGWNREEKEWLRDHGLLPKAYLAN